MMLRPPNKRIDRCTHAVFSFQTHDSGLQVFHSKKVQCMFHIGVSAPPSSSHFALVADAATKVLIPTRPEKVRLARQTAHLQEKVHLRFDSPAGVFTSVSQGSILKCKGLTALLHDLL